MDGIQTIRVRIPRYGKILVVTIPDGETINAADFMWLTRLGPGFSHRWEDPDESGEPTTTIRDAVLNLIRQGGSGGEDPESHEKVSFIRHDHQESPGRRVDDPYPRPDRRGCEGNREEVLPGEYVRSGAVDPARFATGGDVRNDRAGLGAGASAEWVQETGRTLRPEGWDDESRRVQGSPGDRQAQGCPEPGGEDPGKPDRSPVSFRDLRQDTGPDRVWR